MRSQVDDICRRHLGLENNIINTSPSIPYTSESMMHGKQNFQNVNGIKKRNRVRAGRHLKVRYKSNLRERKCLIVAMLSKATKLRYNNLLILSSICFYRATQAYDLFS